MSRDLPKYTASVAFQNVDAPNIDEAIQLKINALKNFNTVATAGTDAFLKMDAQNAKQTLKYNISQSMEGFATQAHENPNATAGAKQFQQQSANYLQQLKQQTNFFNAGFVDNLGKYYQSAYAKPLIKNSLSQTQNLRKAYFALNDNQSQLDVNNAIKNANPKLGDHEFDAAGKQQQLRFKYLLGGVQDGLISPPQFNADLNQTRVDYYSDIALKKMNDAMQTGGLGAGLEVAKQFQKAAYNNLTFEQAQKVHAQIQAQTTGFLQDEGINRQSVQKMYSDDLSRIRDFGGKPNATVGTLYNMLHPGSEETYEKSVQQATALHHVKLFTYNATPQQTQAFLNTLKPTKNDTPEVADAKYNFYTQSQKMVNVANDEIKANPAAIAAQALAVQEHAQGQQNAADTGTAHQNLPLTNFNVVTPSTVNAVVAWEKLHGFTVNGPPATRIQPTTKEFASQFYQNFMAAPIDQKPQMMRDIENQVGGGPNFMLFVDQLHKLGMPSSYAFLPYIDHNDPNINQLYAALATPTQQLTESVSGKAGDSGAEATTIKQDIATKIYQPTPINHRVLGIFRESNTPIDEWMASLQASNMGNNVEYLNNLHNTLYKLASYAYINGLAADPKSASTWAANKLFSNFNFIQNKNYTLAVPKQYSPTAVNLYLNTQAKQVKNFPFKLVTTVQSGLPNIAESADKDRQQILDGHWATGPDSNSAVWIDSNGNMPIDKFGEPFSRHYSDALTSGSTNFAQDHLNRLHEETKLAHYQTHLNQHTDLINDLINNSAVQKVNKVIADLNSQGKKLTGSGVENAS